jgi:hypothetical protein
MIKRDMHHVTHLSYNQCFQAEPQLRWYLQIRPRLTTQAGLEIGSGISINPSIPEDDVDFLNEED